MAAETREAKSEQISNPGGLKWGETLTGFVFVLTCLLILAFIWQSVAPLVFPD
jgi:hypothetical protein